MLQKLVLHCPLSVPILIENTTEKRRIDDAR